jgi:hypothetical protein
MNEHTIYIHTHVHGVGSKQAGFFFVFVFLDFWNFCIMNVIEAHLPNSAMWGNHR